MLQPEMSDIPMSTMGRDMTTRRSRRQGKDEVVQDIAQIKESHTLQGSVMKVVRLIVPHVALMSVFFLYLGFGAWVFYMLEKDCSYECQRDIEDAKVDLMNLAMNRTACIPSGSTPLPPQDSLDRKTPPSNIDEMGNHGYQSRCLSEEEILQEMDEQFDVVMKKMVRSGMTIGKMDSMLVGRTWNLTSAMLFSMTTITTIGYGDIAPETTEGRIFCIFYSIIGIPLALLCLANIGNLLARLTLKICRATHSFLVIRHKVCASCRRCCRRSSKHVPETSSQRKIINGDAEIPMDTFEKPPASNSKMVESNNFGDKGLDVNTNEHPIMRSVSIATERPTSHPHGVTKQPSADAEMPSCPLPCGCEPNQCQCEHKPDILEEVPLLVVVAILVIYMSAGAAWMASAEGWDFGTGIYFMFITLTTIGFGDVLPMKHYADNTFIPCVFFTLFGLAIMSMCIALVQVKVLRGYQFVTNKCGLC